MLCHQVCNNLGHLPQYLNPWHKDLYLDRVPLVQHRMCKYKLEFLADTVEAGVFHKEWRNYPYRKEELALV